MYDKAGDQHYDYISAWIKSTRGSDPDASLYYLAAMIEGGEDPRFIARRMIVLASEDIGNADPQALVIAVAAGHAVEHVGFPEAEFALAQAAIYLSLAPKSDAVKRAIGEVRGHIREHGAKPAPAAAALGRVPGRAQDGARHGLRLPPRPPGPRQRPGAPARGARRTCASTSRTRASPRRRRGSSDPEGTRRARSSVPADAAATPQPLWALVPAAGRARYLRRTATAILDELEDLAGVLADTVGQPRTEAVLAELLPSVGGLHDLADARAARAARPAAGAHPGPARGAPLAARVGAARDGRRPRRPRRRRGPSRARDAAALLAGNAVVLSTPMGDRVRGAFERGGVPLELIAARARPTRTWARSPTTSSTPARAREKGTMLVLDGAPLDRTATGALWAAFAGGGRHRAAVGRLVVVPSVAEPLIAAVVAGAERLRPGNPRRGRDRGRAAALRRHARAGRGARRPTRSPTARRCCAAARAPSRA